MRTHIALSVKDLAASVRFYQALLGAPPARVLPGYAQFLLDEPGLNLALSQAGRPAGAGGAARGQHFGVEVEDAAAVRSALERVRAHGLAAQVEEDVLCCHARQDKFWATDPDGHRWEVFAVAERYGSLEEEEEAVRQGRAHPRAPGAECCVRESGCC